MGAISYEAGDLIRCKPPGIDITVCCSDAIYVSVTSSYQHDPSIFSPIDYVANCPELDAAPIFSLICSTNEDNNELRPVSINILEK